MRDDLAARRLKQRYNEIRAQGYLAGAGLLYELQRLTVACSKGATDSQRVVAFVLATVFDQLARAQDGEMVTADEAAHIHAVLDQPIASAVDSVVRDDTGDDTLAVLTRLVAAHSSLRNRE